MKRVSLIALLVTCSVALAPAASGDVHGCATGSDDTIASPCTAVSGHWYTGVFYSNPKANYDDLDYLKFTVARAGETVHFVLANTTGTAGHPACQDPDQTDCPVYLTLMNSTNHQVGGDTSGAGTIATQQDTESFPWTFAKAGTYYMLVESNGDTSGSPTYAVKYIAPSPKPPPPLVKSFTVPSPQHGTSVHGKLVLGRKAVTLHMALFHVRKNKPPELISSSTTSNVSAGTHHLVFDLNSHWKQVLASKHHLSLMAKIVVTPKTGKKVTKERLVTLES